MLADMNAKTQKMQGGLPVKTQVVWKDGAAIFGAKWASFGAWGDRRHKAGCHPTGRAIDFMLLPGNDHMYDSATGWFIVQWLLANRVKYDIRFIAFQVYKWSEKTGWKRADYGGIPHWSHPHASIGCNG